MKRDATDTKDDIQSLARAHSADAIAVLAEIMNNTDAPAGARLSAAKALLDRGWGKAGAKPPDDGNRATPVSQIKRVIVDPRHDDATRPSPSANVPMTNRAAAGRSSGNPVTGAIFPANSSSFASTKPAILPSSRFRTLGGVADVGRTSFKQSTAPRVATITPVATRNFGVGVAAVSTDGLVVLDYRAVFQGQGAI